GPVARRIMSIGAGVTIFALAVGLIPYWLRRTPAAESRPVAEQASEQPVAEATTNDSPAEPEPVRIS
ncbi:MAG: hypothetical protein AAF266_16850, partial [Planctomycetota bacterium]